MIQRGCKALCGGLGLVPPLKRKRSGHRGMMGIVGKAGTLHRRGTRSNVPLRCGELGSVISAWERVERRLAAIFAADVAAYSRLMSQDEVRHLHSLAPHCEVMDRLRAWHRGQIAYAAGTALRS